MKTFSRKILTLLLAFAFVLCSSIALLSFNTAKVKADTAMTITGLTHNTTEGSGYRVFIHTEHSSGSQLNGDVLAMDKIYINGISFNDRSVQTDWHNDYGAHIGKLDVVPSQLYDGALITFKQGLKFNEWTDPGLASDQTFKYDFSTKTFSEVTSFFTVSDIEMTLREVYNGNVGGIRTEYVISLDAESDVLGAYSVGADVASKGFADRFLVNGKTLKSLSGASGSGITSYSLVKYDANKLKLTLNNKPFAYVEFKINGLVVGDSVCCNSYSFYQNADNTFGDTQGDFRVAGVLLRPYGGDASLEQVNVWVTRVGTPSGVQLDDILINGTAVSPTDDRITHESADYAFAYGNDWDTASAQMNFYIYIKKTVTNQGFTLTFPEGFSTSGGTLTKAQTFYFAPNANSWVDMTYGVEEQVAITSITRSYFNLYQDIGTEYTIEFDKNILPDVAVGSDVSYLKNVDSFGNNLIFNGFSLKSIVNTTGGTACGEVTIAKTGDNKLELSFKEGMPYAEIEIKSYLKIGEKAVSNGAIFTQSEDLTFKANQAHPDFNLEFVSERPNGTGERDILLVFNRSLGTHIMPTQNIYFDGTSLYDLGYRPYGESSSVGNASPVWAVDLNYTTFVITIPQNSASPVVTINASDSVTYGSNKVTSDRTFYPDRSYCDWNNLPVWSYNYSFNSFVWEGATAKAHFTNSVLTSATLDFDASISSAVKIPATCTEKGTTTYTATYDGHTDTNDIQDIPVKGHEYGDWTYDDTAKQHKKTCKNCPDTVYEDCLYDNGVITAPTTEAQGYTTYTCTVCGHTYVSDYTPKLNADETIANIKYTNLSLEGLIGVNFYVEKVTDGDFFMVVETSNGEEKVEGTLNGGYYQFTVAVPVQDFNKQINFKFATATSESASYSYSIADYANALKETPKFEEVKEVINTMTDYADMAKAYFADDTAEVPDEVKNVNVEVFDSYEKEFVNSGASVQISGLSLILEQETTIRLYFKILDETDVNTLTLKANGEDVEAVEKKLDGQKYYYIELQNVAAKDLSTTYSFVVGDCTASCSAFSYAQMAAEKGLDAKLINTLKAMYLYWQACDSYFAD